MSLKDKVIEYYKKENNYSCSEAMIRACNDYYNLNLPEEVFLASSAFSKGMYGGHVCGAVSSSAACIGLMFSNGHAHDSEKMRAIVATLNAKCNEKMTSNKCVELRNIYHTPELRCSKIMEQVANILEETISQYK